jgi:hypothetical protein
LNEKYDYQAETNKTFLQVFKDYGMEGGLKAGVFAIAWYVFNYLFMNDYQTPVQILICGYIWFCVYFTFKPKIISYLKGYRKDNGK